MRLELITIGDELLLGYTIDTNAAYLARELSAAGIEVVRRTTVGDEASAISAAVREAIERTGAVITTGGLGPTSDDRTKPAIAELFGRGMRRDDDVLHAIEERFRTLGSHMPPSNVQQAMIPEGARILHNRHGTAPGIWLEDEHGRWVAMLPGIPREMRGMTNDTLLPLLRARGSATPTVVSSRTLRTTGIGESALAERLGDEASEVAGLQVASLPGWAGVDLRITARGLTAERAREKLDAGAAKLRAHASAYIYGEDDADLAAVVLEQCRARALHIATAESCTGGLLGARLTAIAGSSDVYLGGVVAYSNHVKELWLGVQPDELAQHGAVSDVVARRMASGIASRLGSEIGVGITGIAGPGGGTPDKPVGTVWIAVQVNGALEARCRVYPGDREEIRLRSTQAALDMIRRALHDAP
ncbi:MAG TPA: competence/damage-inducible protein A [Gemmatimonadaceae bacterium]|jgi:nicotinamide-nucleotide amidase|nr:competence/damage-inducible protein A [Gemmatimonadaceae bacterium]